MKKTEGLVAAPATAYLANGEIDLGCVAPMAEHLKRQGVVGVFVNGTTGEGMSLTTEERKELAAQWRKELPSGIRLFVHVGHNSIEESKRLASHAQSIGADAIAGMAPGFFKLASVQGLVSWCTPVAAAAPDLPFYFYHMPSMNGVNVCITDFLQKAAEQIPTLAGIKFTFEAMGDYMEALRLDNGRFDVLWGRDEMLLGALAMGAKGGVGSTFNVISPIYLKLMDAFKRGDMATARDLQAQAIAVINVLASSGNFFSALKSVLRMQGVPISLATRNPLVALTQAQADSVCQRIQEIMPGVMTPVG